MNLKPTFTDRLRIIFKGILDPIGAFLNRLGLTPNAITLLGLVGTTLGAYIISQGKMTTGGIDPFALCLGGRIGRHNGAPAR